MLFLEEVFLVSSFCTDLKDTYVASKQVLSPRRG